MDKTINLYVTPDLAEPSELAGHCVVVIDVLRATTTIAQALASGAEQVIPCLKIDDARRQADVLTRSMPREQILLAGERQGKPIDGFDLGNSPDAFTPELVRGKTVLFTTTNGTRAMLRCRSAREIYLASFVNASMIVRHLMDRPSVDLICAGMNGQYSVDDILVAGLLIERLERESGLRLKMNVQAIAAKETWLSAFALPKAIGAEMLTPEELAKPLRESLGGKQLVGLGMDADILACSRIDRLPVLPLLDTETMSIRAVG